MVIKFVWEFVKTPSVFVVVDVVAGRPEPPVIKNKETQVPGCDVILKWSVAKGNGCPLTMYTIYYRDLQSKNEDSWHQVNVTALTRSLHLSSLKCNTEYDFAVTAWNELGESVTSRGWQIKTFRGMRCFLWSKNRTLNYYFGYQCLNTAPFLQCQRISAWATSLDKAFRNYNRETFWKVNSFLGAWFFRWYAKLYWRIVVISFFLFGFLQIWLFMFDAQQWVPHKAINCTELDR